MNRGISPAHALIGAAVICCLLVAPIAIAQSGGSSGDPVATASGVKKKIKKLKKQVKALKQGLAAVEGEQGSPRPPSGPAGGELRGSYPNPSVGTLNGLDLAQSTSPGAGINFGGDTRLYQGGVNTLVTDARGIFLDGGSISAGSGLESPSGFSTLGPGGLVVAPGAETGSGFVGLKEAGSVLHNSNQVNIYARDNGAGATQLVAIWPGLEETVLATDPVP